MGVLLFSTNFKPWTGGIATFLDQLCAHLPPPVEVVTTVAGARIDEDAPADPYRVTRVRTMRLPGVRVLQVWGALRTAVLRHRPTVTVIGHANLTHWGYPLRFWRRTGARFGILAYALEVPHSGSLRSPWGLQSQMYRDADFVIAISRFTKELLNEAGVDDRKIHIVHPGVGERYLSAEGRRSSVRQQLGLTDAFVLGTVGRLVKRKGHGLVLKAIAQLEELSSPVRYLVAGHGPERERLERLASELGVADRVLFLGHVDEEDLPGLYDAMDLFVLPTQPTEDPYDVEGFGIAFLEAAARGTPSVGCPIGGVPDAVSAGETGLLVPPTPDAIADAIRVLNTDTAMRERMSVRGRQRVEEEFTWPLVAERFAQISGLHA